MISLLSGFLNITENTFKNMVDNYIDTLYTIGNNKG